MSKAPKTESQNKPDILHLLEYCRIDRAAELLDCKVCDLLHLKKMGHISLYLDFNGQPALTSFNDILLAGEKPTEDISIARVIGKYAYFMFEDPNGFITVEDSNKAIRVLLYGLWEYEGGMNDAEDDPSLSLFPCMARSDDGDVVEALILTSEWKMPPLDTLCIKQVDMMRLRKAIALGGPLEGRGASSSEPSSCMPRSHQIGFAQLRESPKACTALVDALKSLGFTQKDFQGSISQLKSKLAAKNLSGTLTDIDDKTLIDWLTKAGVR